MLEFEAPRLMEVQTERSAQYVDHNLFQADHRNADASSPAGTWTVS